MSTATTYLSETEVLGSYVSGSCHICSLPCFDCLNWIFWSAFFPVEASADISPVSAGCLQDCLRSSTL